MVHEAGRAGGSQWVILARTLMAPPCRADPGAELRDTILPIVRWLFLGATLLASLAPGPAVLLAIAVSVRSGLGAAWRAIVGITVANVAFLLVAMAGLMAVLVAHQSLFRAVQAGGAAYLVYLGVRMIRSRPGGAGGAGAAAAPETGGGVAGGAPVSRARPLAQGLVTQLSNPKAIVYWTALLPPFLDRSRPIGPQLLVLVGVGIGVDLVVLVAYAAAAASVRRWMADPRYERGLNLVAGALFTVIGLSLAFANATSHGAAAL
jgi:homoserine/homoserine lactone efflux protein